MSNDIDDWMPEVELRPPLGYEEVDKLIDDFVSIVGHVPHDDYMSFMRRHAGGDGPIGQRNYICIFPLDEVVYATERAGIAEFAPGLLLFASDGGGTGYAFDRLDPGWPIVEVELASMSRKEMKLIARTFSEFIRRLANE